MRFTWQYTAKAVHDLKQLDRTIYTRVVKKIATFCSAKDPFVFAKPLEGPWKGYFRFRIGEYRAVFRQEASGELSILLILRVKHRREVYERTIRASL